MTTSIISQAQIRELGDFKTKPRLVSQDSGYMSGLSGRISSDGSSHAESLSYPDLTTFINQIIDRADESIMDLLEVEASTPSPKAQDPLLKFTSRPPQSAIVINVLAAAILSSPLRTTSDDQEETLQHPQSREGKGSKQHSLQGQAVQAGHITLELSDAIQMASEPLRATTLTAENVTHITENADTLNNLNLGLNTGFEAFEGILAVVNIALEGSRAIGAFKDRRIEDLKDHSSQILHASLMGSAAGVETYKAIQELVTNGWSHVATPGAVAGNIAMNLAPHLLSVAGFALYGTIQAVGMKRVYEPLKALEEAFTSGLPIDTRHAVALQKFAEQFYVTEAQVKEIQDKHPRTEKGIIAVSKEITKEAKLKYNKLEKRVGKKVAQKIHTKLMATYHLLKVAAKHPDDTDLKASVDQAFTELPALIQQYKNGLTKQMVLKSARLFAAIMGVTASAIAVATPVGSAILSGITAGYLLYILYQDKKVDADTFAKTSILVRKLFDFEASPAVNKAPVIEEIHEDAPVATSLTGIYQETQL